MPLLKQGNMYALGVGGRYCEDSKVGLCLRDDPIDYLKPQMFGHLDHYRTVISSRDYSQSLRFRSIYSK